MKYSSIFKIKAINLFVVFCLLFVSAVNAQIELPQDMVKAVYSVEQKGDEATIIATVTVKEHWHINASVLPKGSFGLATEYSLNPSPSFKNIGGIIEPKPIEKYDELADEQLAYHEGTFKLKRKIKVLSDKDFKVDGKFYFQTCNDVRCLPDYTMKFSVNVKGVKKEEAATTVEENPDNETTNNAEESIVEVEAVDTNTVSNIPDLKKEDDKKGTKKDDDNSSLWGIFWFSFGAGFLVLFTPCVFPMIPMTVSFFTHQSPTRAIGIRNSIIYMISIILIYMVLGLALVAIFGDTILHVMSTNIWFNIAFFLILVILAISFMGAFEIRMPSKWINKADSKADKGGLIGIFFMALVLALVSFSCTGPALGFIVAKAASTGGITPIIGMFGFSLALALPFGLFAAFPGWLNTLPKSGGWLNMIKVVLGFVELAFAFKFLSNADLAVQAHFLEREIFVAIWIAIFFVLGLYLLGFIQLPHDTKTEKLSVGRTLFATIVLSFALYLIPGLWGGEVKLINAFAPPKNYSEYSGKQHSQSESKSSNMHPDMHIGPQDIYVFDDYEIAANYAKEVGKPLFVDYTGYNCVNCRKMEESVWGEPGVLEILRDKVVIVSLHQDDGRELPAKEQGEIVLEDGRKLPLETIGDKWRAKQIKEHGILSQPYYIFEDNEGDFLKNGPADFANHRDKEVFQKWLEEGLREYKSAK